MTDSSLLRQVSMALKHYRRAAELRSDPAQAWPAVKELIGSGVGVVQAIRQVLDQALDTYHSTDAAAATFLRQHYVAGSSIDRLATDQNFDLSTVYRQRQQGLYEVAVIIDALNRAAHRQQRIAAFRVQQPVIGVEQLVTDLVDRLRDTPRSAILVLEGMGGLGKTTLARLIAQRCLADELFADVLWTSAKQTTFDYWSGTQSPTQHGALNVQDLIVQLAQQLGIDIPADLPTLRNEVRAHCAERSYLIVFDNLETAPDIASIAPLIEMLTGTSRILITTRDHALGALPLHLDRSYAPVRELDARASCQLLRQAAAYVKAPALESAPDSDLAEIYAVIGGNPLALWLVAGQARSVPWHIFLNDLVTHCPPRSRTYELYDYLYRRSWEQLSSQAQQVLFAMHRCESGVSFDLLFKLSRLEYAVFRAALEELQNQMLLSFDGRYTIHRLTYIFLRAVIAGWWEA